MKKRDKKGVTQIITIVLLILLAIVTVISINAIIKNNRSEEIQTRVNCISDVKIKILNVCYERNLLNIEIRNEDDIILGDFFLIDLFFNNKTLLTIPTPYNTYIDSYETKTIIVPYYNDLQKIRVIPKIEGQNYLCSGKAPEYKDIEECNNEI
jgi:hypothetical protein